MSYHFFLIEIGSELVEWSKSPLTHLEENIQMFTVKYALLYDLRSRSNILTIEVIIENGENFDQVEGKRERRGILKY